MKKLHSRFKRLRGKKEWEAKETEIAKITNELLPAGDAPESDVGDEHLRCSSEGKSKHIMVRRQLLAARWRPDLLEGLRGISWELRVLRDFHSSWYALSFLLTSLIGCAPTL